MQTLLFRRADGAILIVPSVFQPPLASHGEGPLRAIGACRLDLDRLHPDVARDLGTHGYAIVAGEDAAKLEVVLQLARRPRASTQAA